MKIRNIPYGYIIVNGRKTLDHAEGKIVLDVFSKYCSGSSLRLIAENLTDREIEYLPGKTAWDKARIKRLLQNQAYLGKDEYPALIEKSQFELAQNLLANSNTNKLPVDDTIKMFKSYAVCDSCISPIKRTVNSRLVEPVSWHCKQCGSSIRISDEKLKDQVLLLQRRIASLPILLSTDTETEFYSIESKRLTNEIHRQLDSGNFSEGELIKMVLRCAAENYKAITGAQHITDRLTATFAQAGPLSSFNRQLFIQTVKYIRLTRSGEVLLQLQNGKIIGEDDVR